MVRLTRVGGIIGCVLALLNGLTAQAVRSSSPDDDPVEGSGDPHDETIELVGEDEIPGVDDNPGPTPVEGGGPPVEYALTLNCLGNSPGQEDALCPGAYTCDDDAELRYIVWSRTPPATTWTPGGTVCLGEEEAPRPVVTPDLVLREVRRIGLPALQIRVQPAGATLVNFDTIFYAEPEPFARTVTLLSYSVDVEANPTTYGWSFGDGEYTTTETPGAPYPAKDITHSYTSADVVEQPSVDVTYEIRFRVDGGQWQSIDDTITAEGPSVDVEVKEAVPVLTGD